MTPRERAVAAMSGQPPLMNALACDIGGTRTKLGIVRDGRVLAQSIVPSNSKQGLAPRLPTLKAGWVRLLEESALNLGDCHGVGVSFPSLIDHASGRILDCYGKFEDAMDIDLRAWAHAEFGLPLAIENDARMACIGEWRHGAGRGCDNLVMVTVWSSLAVNLIHCYDPELLIFGGGSMASADVILPSLREYVGRHAHTPWGQVRVESSALGDQAALVAAEWLLEEQSIYF